MGKKLEVPPLKFHMRGDLDIYLIDAETGEIAEERHIKNTIVDAGEIWVAELLAHEALDGSSLTSGAGELGNGLQYVHVGSSGLATTQGMFKLQNTSMTSGNEYTSCENDVTSPGNVIVAKGTFGTSDGNQALMEAGLFSDSVAPTSSTDEASRMFNRTTFPVITKTTYFSLTLQWTITIGTV